MFTLLASVVAVSMPATLMWAKITYLFCSDITVTILPFRATPFPRSLLPHKVLYSLIPRLGTLATANLYTTCNDSL